MFMYMCQMYILCTQMASFGTEENSASSSDEETEVAFVNVPSLTTALTHQQIDELHQQFARTPTTHGEAKQLYLNIRCAITCYLFAQDRQ